MSEKLKKIRESLIKFADQLDRQGLYDLVDYLDSKIIPELSDFKKSAEIEEEVKELELLIPEDERAMLEEVLKAFQDSLK